MLEYGCVSETDSDIETKNMFNIATFENEDDRHNWKYKYYNDLEYRKKTICCWCGAVGRCADCGECRKHGRHKCKNHGCAIKKQGTTIFMFKYIYLFLCMFINKDLK